MAEWQLNDSDRAYLENFRISLAEDTRMRFEADARFSIPEWLRRTIWRHFWAQHEMQPELEDSLPVGGKSCDEADEIPREDSMGLGHAYHHCVRARYWPDAVRVLHAPKGHSDPGRTLSFETGRTAAALRVGLRRQFIALRFGLSDLVTTIVSRTRA